MRIYFQRMLLLSIIIAFISCADKQNNPTSGNLKVDVNNNMQTSLLWGNSENQLLTNNSYSDALVTENGEYSNFKLAKQWSEGFTDSIGKGTRYFYQGDTVINGGKLTKQITLTKYNDFSDFFLTQTTYTNSTGKSLNVKSLINNKYELIGNNDSIPFWSFQGESTSKRRDWILPVSGNFSQRNYMGMNNSDYGGGIPVTCIWRPDLGIAIGHVSLHPELVSLPVQKQADNATISMIQDFDDAIEVKAGESISTLQTFVQMYEGDCFKPLRKYSEFMQKAGMTMPESEPDAFEPMWCSWGYERTATFDEVLGTLPKVKELGIKWATVDDGYQIAEGDWDLDPKRFPGGDQEMIDLVNKIKSYDLKVQLWWAPLAADPGTKLLADNPDMVMLSKEGKPYDISWWDSYYISPVSEQSIKHTSELVHRFISKYGFDGLKLDGQHLNAVHPDYSKAHHPEDPNRSVRELPNFFKMIFDQSLEINPHSVIQNCPCGTCMSFYNMPYTNQVVSSDPLNSSQVRTKGYVYRALIPKTAYFGDHVELSDNGDDFESSFGIGAVLGTKFTYPKNNPNVKGDYLLTPEKEVKWKKWFSLYNEKMLSTGEYLGGTYDIGFFKPEAHLIKKDGKMYYAFYADNWDGEIELRGLDKNKNYTVKEYTEDDGKTLSIKGSSPKIQANFKGSYFIEVY